MSRIKDLYEIYREIYVEPSKEAWHLAAEYGYLPYIVQRYIDMLGLDGAIRLIEAFKHPPKPVVRVNRTLIEPAQLEQRLRSLGFQLDKIPWSDNAYWVVKSPESPTIGSTHEYLKGYYYVHRDATSLLPVILLMHEYSGDVLDACAAPGGKTTHIAELLKLRGGGLVYANDLVLYRLRALIGHVMRLKLDNVVVMWSDARKLPQKIGRKFARVLLDAPCSGEGRISVDPTRKTKTSLLDLAIMVRREIELLWSLVDVVEPGGILAYVTCSIAPEENEYVVSEVLSKKGGLELVEPPVRPLKFSKGLTEYRGLKFHPETEKCLRVWPFEHGLFGYAICLLRRKQ